MYVVIDYIDNLEFGFYLEPDYEFSDGEFEPDLIANWLALGYIVDPDAPVAEEEVTEEDNDPDGEEVPLDPDSDESEAE